jgi:hypothetical protein
MRPDVLLSDSAAVALSDLQFVRVTVPGLKIGLIGIQADCEALPVVRDQLAC